MDMYKKREIRKKKREENNEIDKSYTSVNINWYERIYVLCSSIPYKIRN